MNKLISISLILIIAGSIVYTQFVVRPDQSTSELETLDSVADFPQSVSTTDSNGVGTNEIQVANTTDQTGAVSANDSSWRGQFTEYLNDRFYDQAIDLYALVVGEDSQTASVLRGVLLDYLKRLLEGNDNFALQELATLYIERFPEDNEVLLLLAQSYEADQEYLLAIEAYGAMYANALRTGDAKQVGTRLARFVQGMEAILKREFRSMELLEAYQLIEELGMGNPFFSLRTAYLYFELGYLYDAELVAQAILDNGLLADQAQALLNKINPEKFENRAVRLNKFGGGYSTYARLNNRVGMMLLVDTGASISVITPKAFSRLADGAEFVSVRDINTAGGMVEAEIYRINMVRVGDQGVENLEFAVLDFKPGGNISGLLGMNFLENFQFEIDAQKNLLYLRN